MATRAESERANRAWYDERDRQIAERAGLTLQEFRSKAETARQDIMRDPERYKVESRERD